MDTMAWHPSGQGVEQGWLWSRASVGHCVSSGTGGSLPPTQVWDLSISGSLLLLQGGISEEEPSCILPV